ncbi:hypothetical protein GGE16_001798 [Rhizobium leguminosarum]|uniref:Uncharacterized protein n=1 Tax=Rhizobium leguminosarum TaxID=384 RepID=A0AAE2MHW1_RHILE|nr:MULTISPECIES: hypothetical protein [Rhizobium]MBB4289758.1 hypothetical protein [Rhizobium leguminosarum]MBB4296402.1 hypothetical protein [Rhizobium leguminosarum]MBB4308338.1 hypothetical protein [Rhizobium leguminosarum]MBB4416174.1 hypothetical protein [Rhizobium leguminosarum]MBB4430860.1 hypothetical protein [Rhizobium esperanzae]
MLFFWELDPQGMAKLISEVITLPMIVWSPGMSLAYSLWLTSLLPARETIDQSADYA